MRLVLAGVGFLIALAVGYLLFWPVRIEPVAVTVLPNAGFTQAFAPNEFLRKARFMDFALGQGPEDVTVKDGYAYTGLEDGRIVRVRIDGQTATGPAPVGPAVPGGTVPTTMPAGAMEQIANTGGRPLGLQHDPFGNIVVADAKQGLLAINPQGRIFPVAKAYGGVPLRFVDDLDIAKDGTIYFSDASQRFGIEEVMLDFFEGQATGRLFSFSPASGRIEEKANGLSFANGVAIGPDEEYVLVNETGLHRISRVWLKGAKAGQKDIFIENLPGYPDNISYNGRGIFWVALVGPRSKELDDALASPFMRKIAYRLQMLGLAATPQPERYGAIVAIDTNGKVLMTMQDPGGLRIHTITSVNEKDGLLYLGGIEMDRFATIPVPPQLLAPR
jgi:sugar lactone lactonase YvrE